MNFFRLERRLFKSARKDRFFVQKSKYHKNFLDVFFEGAKVCDSLFFPTLKPKDFKKNFIIAFLCPKK